MMVDSLKNLGITESEYNDLVEQNSSLNNLEDIEIDEMIFLLKTIHCSDEVIKNVILSDAFYLSRIKTDIQKLLIQLHNIGISNEEIVDLIDGYPYILEKDDFEIEDFYNSKKEEGLTTEEICDLIISNPTILDE